MAKVLKRRFTPKWDGPIAGYATNYIHKNGWRIKGADWDDLKQEAYLVFLECKERYSTAADVPVDTPQWFMSLFMRCLVTRFADLSNLSTSSSAVNESSLSASEDDDFLFDSLPSPHTISYEFLELIEKAPKEVALVLSLFFSAPSEVLELAEEAWRASGRKKVHGNAFICSLLGLDANKIHLPSAVSKYFEHGVWKM